MVIVNPGLIFYSRKGHDMCIQTVLRVASRSGNSAIMEDGRVVLLGPIRHVTPGDYLGVYANIALERVDVKKKVKSYEK
jgi:fructose-1,6-bisphosphatase